MTYLRNISTTNADTDVPSARAFTRAASRNGVTATSRQALPGKEIP